MALCPLQSQKLRLGNIGTVKPQMLVFLLHLWLLLFLLAQPLEACGPQGRTPIMMMMLMALTMTMTMMVAWDTLGRGMKDNRFYVMIFGICELMAVLL